VRRRSKRSSRREGGLAPEVAWAPIIAPWLSRVAGAPVERPDAWYAVAAAFSAGLQAIADAAAAVLPSLNEAAAAFERFAAMGVSIEGDADAG